MRLRLNHCSASAALSTGPKNSNAIAQPLRHRQSVIWTGVPTHHDENNLVRICPADYQSLLLEMRTSGWLLYIFSAGASKTELFDNARRVLPLDPPLGPYLKWDALSDSLSNGLIELDSSAVAIAWIDADRLQSVDPESFHTAVEVFKHVASLVEFERRSGRSRLHIRILIFATAESPP